jgi:hypothetical protein
MNLYGATRYHIPEDVAHQVRKHMHGIIIVMRSISCVYLGKRKTHCKNFTEHKICASASSTMFVPRHF